MPETDTLQETAPASAAPAPQAAEKPAAEAAPDTGADLLGDPAGTTAETPDDAAATPAAEGTPDYSGLKAPEGAPFADGALDEIRALATEHKLDPAVAQAVTDRYAKALSDSAESYQRQLTETFSDFARQVREDTEWGGKNIEQTKAYFAKAVDKYAPGYRQSLEKSKAFLEPDLYFAFARIGKGMSSPTSAVTGDVAPSKETPYSASFPNTPASLGGSKKE
jgi:hypothetical protein